MSKAPPTSNLVSKLRAEVVVPYKEGYEPLRAPPSALMTQAADEIERLRASLKRIRDRTRMSLRDFESATLATTFAYHEALKAVGGEPGDSNAVETSPKPTRDAEHCDYPDCEQHNTLVVANLTRALAAKQAKIDALMLEFCPSEMSEEQKAEWAKHQKPGSPEEPIGTLVTNALLERLAYEHRDTSKHTAAVNELRAILKGRTPEKASGE